MAFAFFAMTDTRLIHKFPKLSPFRLKFSRLGLSPGLGIDLFQDEEQKKLKEMLKINNKKSLMPSQINNTVTKVSRNRS